MNAINAMNPPNHANRAAALAKLGGWGNGERVFDQDAFDHLARLEIFGQDLSGMACQGRGDDEGIPEGEPMPFLDLRGPKDHLGFQYLDRPRTIAANNLSGNGWREGRGNLAGHVHRELLQHLSAEHAEAGGPQVFEDRGCDRVFAAGIEIMRLDQHVGIDKDLTGHATARGGRGSSRQGGTRAPAG